MILDIKEVIESMREKYEADFLSSQTNSQTSTSYKFIRENGWQDAALRAADAYYSSEFSKSKNNLMPKNINQKIGHGLIVLAGQQVPCKSATRGTIWPGRKYSNDEKLKNAIFAAIFAAGPIALKIKTVPHDFFEKQNQEKINDQNLKPKSIIESINKPALQECIRKICLGKSTIVTEKVKQAVCSCYEHSTGQILDPTIDPFDYAE